MIIDLRCIVRSHATCLSLSVSAPLVESDKEADEENYLLWRLKKGVAEGSIEIPKGACLLCC